MIEAIGSGVTSVIGWLGTVLTALTSETGALASLLPLIGIGVAVSVVMLVFVMIRRATWGA